jgi:hypothetical protein
MGEKDERRKSTGEAIREEEQRLKKILLYVFPERKPG